MDAATASSRWKSPWLWIGVSCGVLVLGIGSCLGVSIYFAQKSYHDVRGRALEEPTLLAAEALARKDRNVAVVSRDTKSHTVKLRNRRTGERFLLGQVEKDGLRIQTEAGTVSPQLAFDRRGRLLLGSAAGPLPAWIPVLPGMQQRPLYAFRGEGFDSGCSIVGLPAKEALTSYQQALSRGGFRVLPIGDSLSASSPDSRFAVSVAPASADRPAGILLTWSKLNGNR